MANLEHKSKGGFLTPFVHRECLCYLGEAIEMAPTYKVTTRALSDTYMIQRRT
jgi:hypothetical protein